MVIEKVIGQVPALAVLVFVVVQFLKALARRDCVIRDLAEQNQEIQREAHRVIQEATKVIAGNTKVLERLNGK